MAKELPCLDEKRGSEKKPLILVKDGWCGALGVEERTKLMSLEVLQKKE